MNLRNLFLIAFILPVMACSSGPQQPKPEAGWQREAKFREFLELSATQPLDSARYVLDTLLKFYGGDSVAFGQLVEFLTPPLSDPNSQVRNEELFIPILEAVIASPFVGEVDKIRPQYLLDLARKNRVGQPAIDFTYTLADGKQATLYGIEAPYTVILLNNPDCPMCRDIKEMMSTSPVLVKAVETGRLKILALYPDADVTLWRNHLYEMPDEWINGYDKDQTLRNEGLYDIRAIPSLYLLDANKTVLLKDVSNPEEIEYYLLSHP